jgi:hypothetical protein
MKYLIATLTALVLAAPVIAHHSLGATYDGTKEVALDGKIVQLLFRNPHSFLHVEAPDKNGLMQRWSLEWRGIGQLDAQGITRDTLKAGEAVTIRMNPSRTPADHRGVLVSLHRKSDGFGWGDKPGETVD